MANLKSAKTDYVNEFVKELSSEIVDQLRKGNVLALNLAADYLEARFGQDCESVERAFRSVVAFEAAYDQGFIPF